jgi:hypothetical protein
MSIAVFSSSNYLAQANAGRFLHCDVNGKIEQSRMLPLETATFELAVDPVYAAARHGSMAIQASAARRSCNYSERRSSVSIKFPRPATGATFRFANDNGRRPPLVTGVLSCHTHLGPMLKSLPA